MKVVRLGAMGMVGQGVLRDCLLEPEVENVLFDRAQCHRQQQEKLHEIVPGF